MGTGSTLRPGEFQRMPAGTGITHSEFNPSPDVPAHFYQILLLPEREGLEPSFEQRASYEEERHNRLRLVASPDGSDRSVTIRQDARLFLATLDEGHQVAHQIPRGRHAWAQILRGDVHLNAQTLSAEDGAAIGDQSILEVRSAGASEILLIYLACPSTIIHLKSACILQSVVSVAARYSSAPSFSCRLRGTNFPTSRLSPGIWPTRASRRLGTSSPQRTAY